MSRKSPLRLVAIASRAAWLAVAALVALAAPVASAQPLDILIYGATGKIGSLAVDEALRRGHHVTAVSRDPASVEREAANLDVVYGDLLDTASIASLVAGQDVVILSVRGVIGDSKTPESALQYIAVRNLVGVLADLGAEAPRLIHVGGAGSLEIEPGRLLADRLPRIFLPRRLEIEIDGQVLALEFLRGRQDVAWTYITPPRNFTNGDRTGEYRIGGDRLLEDERGRSRISRADFAVALIDEAETARHVRERIAVAY